MLSPRALGLRALLIALVSGLVLAILPAGSAQAAVPAAAADCGCVEEGDYETPGGLEEPFVGGDGSSASRNPTYRLSAQGSFPSVSLTVRRTSDNAVVTTINTSHTNWGFSPDQGRLVTWRAAAPNLEVALYDLTGSRPGTPVLNRTTSTADARIAFSSGGRWLSLNWLVTNTSNQAGIFIADARTGDAAYSTVYSYFQAQSGQRFGVAGWGFSPDEGRFFHAHTSAQDMVALALVDLDAGGDRTWTTTMTGTGHWHFSPCGTKLAVVEQTSATQMRTRLVDTATGTVDATRTGPVTGIAFEATAAGHVAWIGGQADVLAPNPPNDCPDEDPPAWPANASLTASSIGRKGLTLSWSPATDDRAVTGYRVYRGNSLVATVAEPTHAVTGLSPDTSYSFRVEAGDAAGNWTTDGPTVQARTLSAVPAWPNGVRLVVDDVTANSLGLRWGAASDASGIEEYVVQRDGVEIGRTAGTVRTFDVSGLAPGTRYTFAVQAVSVDGGVTSGGPSAVAVTDAFEPLDTPRVSGLVWWDEDRDGRHDEGEPGVDPTSVTPNVVLTAHRVDGVVLRQSARATITADGSYVIDGLPDGTYLVELAAWPVVQSAPGHLQPQLLEIVDGRGWGRVDFGLVRGSTYPDDRSAVARGSLFADLDGDAARDPGEPGVPNVGIECIRLASHTIDGCNRVVAFTESDGTWRDPNLVPGSYIYTHFMLPHGFYPLPAKTALIGAVGPDETVGGFDIPVLRGEGVINGTFFRDTDRDGVRDAGETGTGGEDFSVCARNRPIGLDECFPIAGDGTFRLDRLPPGEHRIDYWLPDGWVRTPDPDLTHTVTIAANGDVVDGLALSGDGPVGSIGGVVWEDSDRDRVREDGESALAGVRVCVRSDQTFWRCAVTAEDDPATEEDETGTWRVPHLQDGEYFLHVSDDGGRMPTWPSGLRVPLAFNEVAELELGLAQPVVPGKPRDVAAEPGDSSVTVTWSPPADDGGLDITNYQVLGSLDGEVFLGIELVDADTRSLRVEVPNGTQIWLQVEAQNAIGPSEVSDVVTATARAPESPAAPTLKAVAGDGAVSLTWSEPDDGGADITAYALERAVGAGAWTPVDLPGGGTARAATVTGLTNGTAYRFRVAAVNSVGTGSWSTVTTATPRTGPGAPRITKARAARRSVTLAWSMPSSDGGAPVTDFVVQRRLGAGRWVTVRTPVSTARQVRVKGLRPRTAYSFRVSARNAAGQGAWSAVRKVRTPR